MESISDFYNSLTVDWDTGGVIFPENNGYLKYKSCPPPEKVRDKKKTKKRIAKASKRRNRK